MSKQEQQVSSNLPNTKLRLYYHRGFAGHCPVGVSAVVLAENVEQAKELLEASLEYCHLGQIVNPDGFVEMQTVAPMAIVLSDGDY